MASAPPPQNRGPLIISLMGTYINTWVLGKQAPEFLRTTRPFSYLASFISSHFTGVGCLVKALPVAMLATEAAKASGPRNKDNYGPSIAAGLILSAFGDVFMDLSEGNEAMFTAGLVSFLLGHVAYIRGFASLGSKTSWPLAGGVYGACYAVLWKYIWPHVPQQEKIPVFLYSSVIATMFYKALTSDGRGPAPEQGKSRQWKLSAAGAFSFVLSDMTLALNKFNPSALTKLNDTVPLFSNPKLFVMLTYYAAQVMIGYAVSA